MDLDSRFPEASFLALPGPRNANGCARPSGVASSALEEAMAVTPPPFIRERPAWYRPEDRAHFLEGLRKAGWSE